MGTDTAHVLIVEDDSEVREALGRALKLEGYGISLAADGQQALNSVSQSPPDLIVLDVSMPGLDGLGVARALRAANDRTPVLMLTARDAVQDRVLGLNAGADDYLVKPFALAELVARINALLRRAVVEPPVEPGLLSYGDLVLDLAAARVTRGGREVTVTRTEYLLLELFLRNPGRVLSHSQIFQAVWGYDFGLRSHNLWVYMS
ncbi:MAG TPA: response regulator transcription factor, partial [Actinospica sp.]|nr:response regulator transcription factor [Actinospica sp.]